MESCLYSEQLPNTYTMLTLKKFYRPALVKSISYSAGNIFMNIKYEDEEETSKEACDEITHFLSSTPPPSTSHYSNDNLHHLSQDVMNNDIHQNNPEVETTLQKMNFLTDGTELVYESGWNQTNTEAASSEVKQEDADDSAIYPSADEDCCSNITIGYKKQRNPS